VETPCFQKTVQSLATRAPNSKTNIVPFLSTRPVENLPWGCSFMFFFSHIRLPNHLSIYSQSFCSSTTKDRNAAHSEMGSTQKSVNERRQIQYIAKSTRKTVQSKSKVPVKIGAYYLMFLKVHIKCFPLALNIWVFFSLFQTSEEF